MKKILIAMLILMSATAVEAKTSYTDYTFTGYVETQKEDDELYRYEKVTINKYYKLVEVGEYLEEDNDKGYSNMYLNDFVIKTVKSLTPSKKYVNEFKVMLKNQDNYITNKIQFSNIENYESFKIKEIEIYQKGEKKSITSEYAFLNDEDYETCGSLTTNSFDIKIPDGYMNDTEIRIYYETDKDINMHVFYKNATGLMPLNADIVLYKDSNKVTINSLKTNKFSEFLAETEFSDEDIIYYYQYNVIRYKYYDLQKEYLEGPVESAPQGYAYDPSESYTMYKEYKREKIESDDNLGEKEDNKDGELSNPKEEDVNVNNKTEENVPSSDDEEEKLPVKDPIVDIEDSTIKEDDNVKEDNESTEKDNHHDDEEKTEPKDEEVESENSSKNESSNQNDSAAIKNTVSDKPILTVNKKDVLQNNSSWSTDENVQNDEEKDVATSQVSKSLDEKNKNLSKEDKKEDSAEECGEELSPFTLIGIILLFLSVAFDVIYLICVKRKKE